MAKLDLQALKQSVNRLPIVSLFRQTGNSLRIASGQQLSWSFLGSTNPPMAFHRSELWAAEGLRPVENQERLAGALVTIRKYNALLRSEGWILVVLPVPTKLSVYNDCCDWPRFEKDLLTRRPIDQDQSDELYSRLITELKADSIPVVDLAARYRQHRTAHPAELLYPLGETHWSGTGLKLAADATAGLVSEITGIVRRQFSPSYLPVEEVSDIGAGYNPLPQWTSRLRPIYTYHDSLVNGAEGTGFIYPTNPNSLLILAGTSYSGQFTWHIGQPVGLAWVLGMQLEECEFHNGAMAGHGSFEAFARFLAERTSKVSDFSRRRNLTKFPKIIVWEFPLRDLDSLIAQ